MLRFLPAAVVLALAGSPAQAQTGPAAAPPQPPPVFSGAATVSMSFESGQTDLNGIQVEFQGRRPYAATTLTMWLSYAHATTDPPGASGRVTVADRLTASFEVERNLGERLVLLLRAQALRDPVKQINYRVGEMAGLGVRLGNARLQVRFIPGLAFLASDKNIAADKGFNLHYGFYEDFTATLSPEWTFTQYAIATRDVSDARDYVHSIHARLIGAITRRLAVQVSYQYDFERLLPPGVSPDQQKTMFGLQLRF